MVGINFLNYMDRWVASAAATPIENEFHLNDAQFAALFDDFKALADRKKEVYDDDLIVLIEKQIDDVPAHWVREPRRPSNVRHASPVGLLNRGELPVKLPVTLG